MKSRTFLATMCLGSLGALSAVAQTIQVSKENRTIAVTASGTASVDADIATAQIGFVAYGASKDAAYAEGSRVSNGIIKALSDAGVAKNAIESASQAIAPLSQYEKASAPAGMEFRLSQSWSVKSGAADAARVFDVAVKAGANDSGQISWGLKDASAVEAQAAGSAMARARTIAEQMASGLGIHLGALVYASNQASEGAQPRIQMFAKLQSPSAGAAQVFPLAINPRRVERSATVYAVFAIE